MPININSDGYLDKAVDVFNTTHDIAKEGAPFLKLSLNASAVAEHFTEVPSIIYLVADLLRPLKIIKGAFSVLDIGKHAVKFVVKEGAWAKSAALFGIYAAAKRIQQATLAVFVYLSEFGVQCEDQLRILVLANYIFMPLKLIMAGVSAHRLGTKIAALEQVSHLAKAPAEPRTLRELKEDAHSLRKIGIIEEDCLIEKRCNSLIKKLKSENKAVRTRGARESKALLNNLKSHVTKHVAASAVDTSLRTLGLVTMAVGMATPVAPLTMAVLNLSTATIATTTGLYTKYACKFDCNK
jgi:hypothetical protein